MRHCGVISRSTLAVALYNRHSNRHSNRQSNEMFLRFSRFGQSNYPSLTCFNGRIQKHYRGGFLMLDLISHHELLDGDFVESPLDNVQNKKLIFALQACGSDFSIFDLVRPYLWFWQ